MTEPADHPFLQVFRVWAGMAWADGVIDEREAVAMKALIGQASLDDDVRDVALSYLSRKVELDFEALAGLPAAAREAIYQAAARLALVDEKVVAGELAFLDRLVEPLGLTEERAREIERSVGVSRSTRK